MSKFKVGDRVKFTECAYGYGDPAPSWEENGTIVEIFEEYDETWALIERDNKPSIIRSIKQIWEW